MIESDKSQNLKEIMISVYWSEWQTVIKIEDNSFLKNQVWKLTQLSSETHLLTER